MPVNHPLSRAPRPRRSSAVPSPTAEADLVLVNAKVITVDGDFSLREAVAVSKGRILAVGRTDEVRKLARPSTRVLDLKGLPVLPGINESHLHGPFFGATRPPLALDLTYPAVRSIPEMVEALRKKALETAPGEWIRGFGWDQASLEECRDDPSRLPRKYDLDPVTPRNPVVFTDFSGHTLLVNSRALELAGVTRETPDPPSGEVERDERGDPTGILKEPQAQALVSVHVPLLTREEKKTALLTALRHLNANGVTSFTDAAIGPGGDTYVGGVMSAEFVALYQELLAEGKLTARATVLLLLGQYGALTYDELEEGLRTFPRPGTPEPTWLQFPGVKLFADGIPLTYTSWMNEPYVSGNAGRGRSVLAGATEAEQAENLARMIALVHRQGFQVAVHATGDRAIDATVEGFARALREDPGGDPRHYVIHGDFISPRTTALLAELGCGLAIQPFIGVMIADFEPAIVGKERAAREWPLRSLLDAGVKLTSNSDAPVTYPNWRKGVQAAVLRESLLSGAVSGPEERITVEEALRTYTINGAWQDGMDDVKGSIEPGKCADFCVIGEDILRVDPHRIGDIPVLMTIAGGEVVFDESGGRFG
ncbi:MAG: amidohydrolase [Deltaproteobacteria bacterium]|nr:amidohydrolase [Deltaproteobacteria bacterium]